VRRQEQQQRSACKVPQNNADLVRDYTTKENLQEWQVKSVIQSWERQEPNPI
jgi:hypothetical protein